MSSSASPASARDGPSSHSAAGRASSTTTGSNPDRRTSIAECDAPRLASSAEISPLRTSPTRPSRSSLADHEASPLEPERASPREPEGDDEALRDDAGGLPRFAARAGAEGLGPGAPRFVRGIASAE
jgi:hypothetical protein